MDLDKYRSLFVEECTEHLAEISRALLELEKDPARTESIDLIFRMAHSIKGMAASLDYESLSRIAHALEDRMQRSREAARVDVESLGVLFRGLEGLEGMVAHVRDTGEAPPARPELAAALSEAPRLAAGPGKKAPGPPARAA